MGSLLMGRALNEAAVLFDKPCMETWWPTGMLPGRRSWSLYLSVLYPIRVSPPITPSIQRMRTAFTKLHTPSSPLFTLLTVSVPSSPPVAAPLPTLPHIFTHHVRLSVSLTQLIFLMWTTKWGVGDFFSQNDSCDNFVAWSRMTVKIGFTQLMPSYLVKIA